MAGLYALAVLLLMFTRKPVCCIENAKYSAICALAKDSSPAKS